MTTASFLFYTHTVVVVIGLLMLNSMYICAAVDLVLSFLILNDIRSFPFVEQYILKAK